MFSNFKKMSFLSYRNTRIGFLNTLIKYVFPKLLFHKTHFSSCACSHNLNARLRSVHLIILLYMVARPCTAEKSMLIKHECRTRQNLLFWKCHSSTERSPTSTNQLPHPLMIHLWIAVHGRPPAAKECGSLMVISLLINRLTFIRSRYF